MCSWREDCRAMNGSVLRFRVAACRLYRVSCRNRASVLRGAAETRLTQHIRVSEYRFCRRKCELQGVIAVVETARDGRRQGPCPIEARTTEMMRNMR